MAGDSDLAPWEKGSGVRKPAASDRVKAAEEAYKLPADDKLPEVLKPETGGMVAAGDVTVPRPPISTPRAISPRAKAAFVTLGVTTATGLVLAALPYVVLDASFGNIRLGAAAFGGLLALASLGVFAIEWGRLTQYRTLGFFPAVLCFGSTHQFEKFAGPAGMAGITSTRIRGSGKGILNSVFDRSAKAAHPPEVVALLVDRGGGPELVGVEWDAVRSCQRGDIVWYHAATPTSFVFFHLMVPFAPALATDRATREEAFRALKVGKSMYKEFPKKQVAAGVQRQAKVMQTDASGNIVAASDSKTGVAAMFHEVGNDETAAPQLSAPGSLLGSGQADPNAMQQSKSNRKLPIAPLGGAATNKPKYDPINGQTEYSPPPSDIGKFRIADSDKPLGSYGEQDQSGEET